MPLPGQDSPEVAERFVGGSLRKRAGFSERGHGSFRKGRALALAPAARRMPPSADSSEPVPGAAGSSKPQAGRMRRARSEA